MTTDLATLLDGLLVIAGLVLVITGIVMFIRSKSSTDPSSVEAFGIKLNVTHPSLILVLAGTGLMLAPRLLPELPEKPALPETEVAATAPPASPPQASVPPSPAAATHTPDVSPRLESTTVAAPPALASAVTPHPVAAETPGVSRPGASPAASKPAPRPSLPRIAVATPSSQPTPKPTPKPAPEPVASSTSPAPSASPPLPAPPQSSRPTFAYAALGLPISRSFWSGETRASYTARINTTLQQSGREVLRMTPHNLSLDQGAFDAWWDESKSNPRSRELCAASHSPRALFAARVETPASMSSIESAYWPELKLRLYICANHKQYRQQKTLSPVNADNWPFSTELNSEIERFMRTYRADLSE